jgi:hypothetical protein
VNVCRQPPTFWEGRLWRCHRHLWGATGDERGEGDADGAPVAIGNPTGKQEPGRSTDILSSGRGAGVGWSEAQTVRAFDRSCGLAQLVSQLEKLSGAGTHLPRRRLSCAASVVEMWRRLVSRSRDGSMDRRLVSWVVVVVILAVTVARWRVRRGGYGEHIPQLVELVEYPR